ncbi:hypothetical protein RUND412_007205 [Rhizina undulata]
MCGRYALAYRPSEIRRLLEDVGIAIHEAPNDDDSRIRQSFNIAPGFVEPVCRAIVAGGDGVAEHGDKRAEGSENTVRYILEPMKWGLIPSWTKRNPDYGSMLRTINCRDDSLSHNSGMWTSMKHRKRCIIVAQGFFEWLKKGKEKIPYFIKRKDGQLLCMAGLWDCVQFKGSEENLYTYTVITTTTASTPISFLHDRMPVILEGENLKTWLSPTTKTWNATLQLLLKPYSGPLEVYPVKKEVGKVGNDSPDFIVPLDSKENKDNIKNFFASQKSKPVQKQEETESYEPLPDSEEAGSGTKRKSETVKEEEDEEGLTRKSLKVEEGSSGKDKEKQDTKELRPVIGKPITRSATINKLRSKTPEKKAKGPRTGQRNKMSK